LISRPMQISTKVGVVHAMTFPRVLIQTQIIVAR
jgi:hypothetical protein